MMINRENYEIYFIDYLEGNLEKSLVNDFIEFIQNNPDLKEELSHFEAVSLEPGEISFDKKDTLYKEKLDSEKEFNKAAIANLESELSETDKTELDTYLLKHPAKNREISLFSKTKLQPDESIQFKYKNKLYRRMLGRTVLLWSGRIAAVLVLAFALYLFIDRPATEAISENNVAMLEDKKVKKAETPNEIKKVPAESQKKETEKIKKATIKPTIKKVTPKQKPKRSLRESTKGRLTHEGLVMNRIPVEVPATLNSISASLDIQLTKAELADMYIIMPERVESFEDEQLLVDVVRDKTGLDKFRFNKITKAGLNLVSSISNDKFKYRTDSDGNITEYKFDS
ncbi:hypothetical protein N9164_16665, partial [Draconibacterium sp.]|nr:hypothetical protein [Draconibacterium sp.]